MTHMRRADNARQLSQKNSTHMKQISLIIKIKKRGRLIDSLKFNTNLIYFLFPINFTSST